MPVAPSVKFLIVLILLVTGLFTEGDLSVGLNEDVQLVDLFPPVVLLHVVVLFEEVGAS